MQDTPRYKTFEDNLDEHPDILVFYNDFEAETSAMGEARTSNFLSYYSHKPSSFECQPGNLNTSSFFPTRFTSWASLTIPKTTTISPSSQFQPSIAAMDPTTSGILGEAPKDRKVK